jgi:flagellar biosynthesis protein FlhG
MMIQETLRTAPTAATAPVANAIAVASGKGGVGKTWLSITLAHALANLGRRTVLIDGDLGLANVDIQLGLSPEVDLAHVLDSNEVPLAQAAQLHEPTGLHIVAGRSGVATLATLSTARLAKFGQGIADISGRYDRVLIDLGAGVERPVRYLAASAQRTLVVTNDEPTSLTDAYALIKLLVQDGARTKVSVIVNAAASKAEGERTYKTLAKACDTFLKMTPPLLGVVRRDAKVRDAIRAQTPLLTRHPGSDAARDVEAIAQQLAQAS